MESLCTNYEVYTKEASTVIRLLLDNKDELIDGWYINCSGMYYSYNLINYADSINVGDELFWNSLENINSESQISKSALTTQLIRYLYLNKSENFSSQDYFNVSDDCYEYYFFEVGCKVYAFKLSDDLVELDICKYRINGNYLISITLDSIVFFFLFGGSDNNSVRVFWENSMKSFRRALATGVVSMDDIMDDYIFEV